MTRASTPIPGSESATSENNTADDALLRQFAAAMIDINAIQSQVMTFYREGIDVMLPETPGVEEGGNSEAEGWFYTDLSCDSTYVGLLDALKHQLSALDYLIAPMSTQIIQVLTRRSCDAIQPASRILSQFTAMSNKRTPTEPSFFVPNILRPIRNFFRVGMNDGLGGRLKDDFMKTCATEVFESVCHRQVCHWLLFSVTDTIALKGTYTMLQP